MYFEIIPILLTLLAVIYPLVVWSIAVINKHVEPILPYLSDASIRAPEASYSSYIINIVSVLVVLFAYIRYQNTRKIYSSNTISEGRLVHQINTYSLICGLIAGFGLLLIANCQLYQIRVVHSIGFVLMIALTVIDINFQYKIAFISGNMTIGKKRAVIAIAIIMSFIIFFVSAHISMKMSKPENFFDDHFRCNWKWTQNGYVWHVLSALFEWIIIFLIALYNSTFICELRTFDLIDFPYTKTP